MNKHLTGLLLLMFALDAAANRLIIHAGELLATPGSPPSLTQTVIVDDNRITGIVDGFQKPGEGDTLLYLREQFVLPGLMDMHVHLLLELDAGLVARRLRESRTLNAMRGVANAQKTLQAGFTTVRDLGGDPESIYALRDAIEMKLVSGPRVFAAGSALAATGGHGDVDGVRPELMKMWTPSTICDGAVDCRRATREAIKFGADLIKITATGGVLSDAATGLGVQMTDAELSEIVQTAHSLGRKVAAHAHGTDGINAALRAGVDTIDHGTFLDQASIKLFKRNGAHFVPTLMPGHVITRNMDQNPYFTEAIKAKATAAANNARESLRLAYSKGVNIAFGTDSGVTPHGENAQELVLMVEVGMSPMDVLKSATVTNAALLELNEDLGTIEAGKLADIIAVTGSPLEDIRVMQSIHTVIADGKVVRHLQLAH